MSDRSGLPRRTVTLCLHTRRSGKRLGPVRLWAFGYSDLAALLGVTERAVRGRVRSEQLRPEDLGDVVEAAVRERTKRGDGRCDMIEVTDSTAGDTLKATPDAVLFFCSPTCGPCRQIERWVERLGKTVIKADVVQAPGLANAYHVTTVPTLYLIQGGTIREVVVGGRPEAEVRKAVQRVWG